MKWPHKSLRPRTHSALRRRYRLRPQVDAMEDRCLLTAPLPVGVGVMGDSFSNPARYPNPSNWVQQLNESRGLSFGATSDQLHYSDVVPTFDTNNTNAYDAAQFQARALLNLIQNQGTTIDAGVLEVGSHDLGPIAPTPAYNDNFGNGISNTYQSIYNTYLDTNGNPVGNNSQLSGANLSNYIDRTVGYIISAATQLQAAGANMVVANIPDFGDSPYIRSNSSFSDPAKRFNVSAAVSHANDQLQAETDGLGIPLLDFQRLVNLSIGTNPLIVGGVTVGGALLTATRPISS